MTRTSSPLSTSYGDGKSQKFINFLAANFRLQRKRVAVLENSVMSKIELQDSKFELKDDAMKSLHLKVDENEKKADEIDGKLVEMKMVTEEKVKSLVTQDSFDCLGKTIQEVMSDVTNHLNKNSEAFDMMHQSSMEMASSAISQLRTSMENTGDTAAEEMVLLHQKVDEKSGAISELRIALKKMEVKIGAQVVSPFDGKTIAKDLEQTFMGKLEKMNTCLVECLDIRMDKFKKHFDDELAALVLRHQT